MIYNSQSYIQNKPAKMNDNTNKSTEPRQMDIKEKRPNSKSNIIN